MAYNPAHDRVDDVAVLAVVGEPDLLVVEETLVAVGLGVLLHGDGVAHALTVARRTRGRASIPRGVSVRCVGEVRGATSRLDKLSPRAWCARAAP